MKTETGSSTSKRHPNYVEREDKTAKFWLNPVRLEESYGFQPHELNRIQYLIEEYRQNLLQRWEDFFHE